MIDGRAPRDEVELVGWLRQLHEQRWQRHEQMRGTRRKTLRSAERQQVFEKAGGRCHICGGQIDGDWNADHVRPHSDGGAHAVENYLPAHGLCNNYRWDYGAEEFQLILKLGVWLRSQIEKQTAVGCAAAGPFVRYEQAREQRRRPRRRKA